jgi:acetyl esterase/lipase
MKTSACVSIWPEGAPGARGVGRGHSPGLVHFPVGSEVRATGASVLVLPGGGYQMLAEHEGAGYARWFAARGLHAAVLDYRLAAQGYRHPAMLQDAARALRVLRAEARAQGRDPNRVAVIGSSAGGHLAATLSTLYAHADAADRIGDAIGRESARPDMTVLCYPVVSFSAPFTHVGSRENLLGAAQGDEGLRGLLSAERHVRADTPPAFVWHTADDTVVPAANAIAYAEACWQAGVACALHIFPKGVHGLGLGREGLRAPPWDKLLENWMSETLGWR